MIGTVSGDVTKWKQSEESVISRLGGNLYSRDLPDLALWRDNHFYQLAAWNSFCSHVENGSHKPTAKQIARNMVGVSFYIANALLDLRSYSTYFCRRR